MMSDTQDREEGPSAEMPRYKCHKEVWALKIKAIEQAPADSERQWPSGDWLLMPEEAGYAPLRVGHEEYMLRCKPEVGGYYVVYADGYTSYSPAKAFEDGYGRADGRIATTEHASHASKVLYPAIKAAMAELDQLPEAFNFTVNRAFNTLHDAYWSETPAPASAAPKRANLG
jgi:hypothetical protein